MSSPVNSDFEQAIPVDKIRYDERGLVPAIIQDYLDGTVLMMAWMNQDSLHKTLSTGETWFWSRSRQELWHKGATSGHLQKVQSIRYDCDSDALLIGVEQIGDIACHTGERSCFHQVDSQTVPPPRKHFIPVISNNSRAPGSSPRKFLYLQTPCRG